MREAYETLNGNMHHGKYQTEPGKEMEMVMRLMLGIVVGTVAQSDARCATRLR